MRLLIVSLMPHHCRDGVVVGWGPTVRELDHLATRFRVVRHIAALYDGPAPASALPYAAKNVQLVPVRPSGGPGLLGKLDVARAAPAYVRAIRGELRQADMVHVRAPANIALLGMLLLAVEGRGVPCWFKYAGNWRPNRPESPSYTFQRWWLSRGFSRGVVTVNGEWPDQPRWVRTLYNPSLDDADLEKGERAARGKQLGRPIQLLFVGRIEEAKGAGRALKILAELRRHGIDAELDLVGDGPERDRMERLAVSLDLSTVARFRGWLPHTELPQFYERSHVVLLPSASEGWPKVLSEGMAYGAVPLAGAVSSIPQYLAMFRVGAALDPHDVGAFARTIVAYRNDPDRWAEEANRAVRAAPRFSFQHYLTSVDQLLAGLGVTVQALT